MQEKLQLRESKAALDLQRAVVAKEQRILDRQELMGWTSVLGEDYGSKTNQIQEKKPRKKRRLWEVINGSVLESAICLEDSREQRKRLCWLEQKQRCIMAGMLGEEM